MIFRPHLLAALLSLACACATGGAQSTSAQPTATSGAPPAAEAPADAVQARAEELLTALRADQLAQATAHFDGPMQQALPTAKLGAVWSQLEGQNGKLLEWKLGGRQSAQGKELFVYGLRFQKGRLLCQIAIDPAQQVAGLFFRPAP